MEHSYNSQPLIAIFLSLTILILLPPTSPSSTTTCTNSIDCQALVKLKQSITNDPDGHLEAWNQTSPFCSWIGIKCHQNRVTSIDFVNMNLYGTISPFISNLSLLTNLSLQDNNFHGYIPTSIQNLSQLSYFNLSGNKLQGSIPASIQACRSLKTIDFTYNNLSGSVPDELGSLNSLTYLSLSVNSLNGVIPDSFSNLTELLDLELAVNYFTGKIPAGLGLLTKLEIMYFHTNYLEGTIPVSISNCSSLREVTLSENLLVGEIPMELGEKLHNLEKLYLLKNQFSGRIPATLSNLSELTLLDLSLNKLVGEVPEDLGKLKKMQILYLHSNDLISGSKNSSHDFLTALTNCSFLLKLHLGSCLFSGNLPSSIGHLSKELYYFNLIDNKITGSIHEGIGNLSSLVYLNLQYNHLSGIVPSSIGKFGELQRLYLGHNKLHGSIPDEIGQMGNLGFLDLSNNSINGSIPFLLGNISQLRYLYLSHNHLSGRIPVQLSQCSLLMLLDLSFNNLEGSLPIEISLLSNLALFLNVSNNNLSGELPESIGRYVSIQAIDLSANNFSGTIPTSIGNCISLEYLNLSSNMLVGKIPESLTQITQLKVLNLSYNRLTGEIPTMGNFENFSESSFVGNAGLCGGSKIMGLASCEAHHKKNHKTPKWICFVLAVLVSCMLLFFVMVIVFRTFCSVKNLEENSISPSLVESVSHSQGGRRITQRELEIATCGFSEENFLGKGGFGSVYKGTLDGETIVAVKVLDEQNVQGYRSFKRECEILSQIRHRNLVRMLGATWSLGFKAIILEFMENGNLGQHLYPNGTDDDDVNGCQLTLRERIGIAIDVANGLEYLHGDCPVQIVHCDLKPENVLLDFDMVAHLSDFGIGKLMWSNKSNGINTNNTGFLRGSIGYIPPEYAQGIEVSEKGDVFSFGIMILEMVTRKRPTSQMFSNGLHIRKWVSSAFPKNVLDVVDVSLKHEANAGLDGDALDKLKQSCIRVFEMGILCTEENPKRRPSMALVAQKLKNVWEELGFEINSEKQEKPCKVSGKIGC